VTFPDVKSKAGAASLEGRLRHVGDKCRLVFVFSSRYEKKAAFETLTVMKPPV
jgi:hypothetical protein